MASGESSYRALSDRRNASRSRGRQHGQDLLLAAADGGLDRPPEPAALRGQRQQVHPPVGGVWLALDQPALLQFVQIADDAALVRPDGLGQCRLGPHRLFGQRAEHDVPHMLIPCARKHRLLGRHQRPGQGTAIAARSRRPSGVVVIVPAG